MELCAERNMEGGRTSGEAIGKLNIKRHDMQGVTHYAVTNFRKTKYRIFEPVI